MSRRTPRARSSRWRLPTPSGATLSAPTDALNCSKGGGSLWRHGSASAVCRSSRATSWCRCVGVKLPYDEPAKADKKSRRKAGRYDEAALTAKRARRPMTRAEQIREALELLAPPAHERDACRRPSKRRSIWWKKWRRPLMAVPCRACPSRQTRHGFSTPRRLDKRGGPISRPCGNWRPAATLLTRISHTAECIEAANQRKPLCCNHFRRLAERAHADRVSPGFVWICTR